MQKRWVYGLNCKLHPIGFSKYEFNNKLLSGVTLFRVTLSVTWYLYIYIYIYTHIHMVGFKLHLE